MARKGLPPDYMASLPISTFMMYIEFLVGEEEKENKITNNNPSNEGLGPQPTLLNPRI